MPIVIVGGAGFIGANLAESWLAEGARVTIVDTLARPGVEANLAWLQARHGDRVRHLKVDVRDGAALEGAVRRRAGRRPPRRAGGGDDLAPQIRSRDFSR